MAGWRGLTMVLRASMLFAQLLQAHAATRAALDHFGAWILRQPAIDQRAVLALVGLEGDWQAADALLGVAEDGETRDVAMAAAAVSQVASRIRHSEWTAQAGGVVPWPPAVPPAADLLAPHLAGMAATVGVGLPAEVRVRQEQLAAFATNVLAPQLPDSDDPVVPTGALLLEMAGQGAWQRVVPAAYGGQSVWPQPLDLVIDAQGFAEAGVVVGLLAGHPVMAVQALLHAGTEAQRQQWLPGLASGEALGTVAIREPGSGEDPAGWTLVARQQDGFWVLDGLKQAVWFAGPAHWVAVAARLGHAQGDIGWFIVPKSPLSGPVWTWEAPDGGQIEARLTAGPAPGGMVRHDLQWRGVCLPAAARLGAEQAPGQGAAAYMAGWELARLQSAGVALGILQAGYEAIWRATVSRTIAGRQGLDSPVIRHYLAGLAWRIQAARQLTYRTARLPQHHAGACALAQVVAGRACGHAVRLISELLGEPGPADAALWRAWRQLTALPVLTGSPDILALRLSPATP
jgi:(2S)-methylsuccinyl-CoA dehydrogenase